jgi:hypothetical protein
MGETPTSPDLPSPPADPYAPGVHAPTERLPGWAATLLIGLGYLLFWQITLRMRTDSLGAILTSTIIALGIILWFAARFARSFRTPTALVINSLVAAATIIPLQVAVVTGRPLYPWAWLVTVPGLPHLLTVWLAASLGGLLSFLLRGANMIPPVAAVLALVDIWTVLLGGPVQQVMESENRTARAITQVMTVPLPRPAPRGASPIPAPLVVGFADFFFIAFFVAGISRFVPEPRVYRRMVAVLIGVLCGYMLVVFFTQWSLPALVPMAVVMLALHWRHFHYQRSEAFALLYAGLFIAVIAGAFWFFSRRAAPPEPIDPDADRPRAQMPAPRIAST